jgi:hypothetical protein
VICRVEEDPRLFDVLHRGVLRLDLRLMIQAVPCGRRTLIMPLWRARRACGSSRFEPPNIAVHRDFCFRGHVCSVIHRLIEDLGMGIRNSTGKKRAMLKVKFSEIDSAASSGGTPAISPTKV